MNHTKKEYARGDVHENRAECLFSLLKPYLRVFRGISKTNLPGYVGFFQFLRNFHQLTAFEQAEMILYAALDPAVASKARKGDFVRCLDHFELLQSRDKLSDGDRPVRSHLGRVKQLVTSSQAGFQGPLPPSYYARRPTRPTSSHTHHVSDQL